MYPREAEVLLGRVVSRAADIQNGLEYLEDPCHTKTSEQVSQVLVRTILAIREIRFDVLRAAELAKADTDALRDIYEHSTGAVDAVRANGALGSPLDPIAEIQDAIRGLFHDNELITE